MCGIFGLATNKDFKNNPLEFKNYSDGLFKLSETRGKEAAGLALVANQENTIYKEPIKATDFIKTKKYLNIFNNLSEQQKENNNNLN